MVKKLTISYLIVFLSYVSYLEGQQNITLSGFVRDAKTNELLLGATVFEASSFQGTVSNEFGFFSLNFNVIESLVITVTYVGYEKKEIVFDVVPASPITIYLEPGVGIKEVTVTSNAYNIVSRDELGVVRLPVKEIKLLPNLFGEVDIIQAYQLTPGVQSGGEGKSDMYVRGGSPDQNLILLDDVPLYHVSHFGGFFSIFNADAIQNVTLIKGGFPARYGSRLSSVLDVRMKDGNMQEMFVQGTVGLLSSKIAIEAPLIKNRSSFLVSARKNMLPLFKILGSDLAYNFYDLNAKFNYQVSEKNRLLLSFYHGIDIVGIEEEGTESFFKQRLNWGNTMWALRWNRVYNSRLFSNITVLNTFYHYTESFNYELDFDTLKRNVKNTLKTGINDIGIKMDFHFMLNPGINIRFGYSGIHHTFTPNDEAQFQSGADISDLRIIYKSEMLAIEQALYIENNLNFGKIGTNAGMRLSTYHLNDESYYSLEPRVLLNWKLKDNLSVKYAFSIMNQYIHLLSFSGTGLPSDYWMPSTKSVKPGSSVQHSIGVAKNLSNNLLELGIDGYYKTLTNQVNFKPGSSLSGNHSSWENAVEVGGTGLNYGIEAFLQKNAGSTTGWIGLTLARAIRQFAELNLGNPFPFKYDRLLDVSIVCNHVYNDNLIISATWQYGRGYPITLAKERYYMLDQEIFVYDEINSFRMRDFHRLDAAIHFPKKTKWGERTFSISVYNIYNRRNPYYYYYHRDFIPVAHTNEHGTFFTTEPGELKLKQRSLFSFFPSFSYSFKF